MREFLESRDTRDEAYAAAREWARLLRTHHLVTAYLVRVQPYCGGSFGVFLVDAEGGK